MSQQIPRFFKWLMLALAISMVCISPGFADTKFSLDVNNIERDQTVVVSRTDSLNSNLTPQATAQLVLTGESGEAKRIPEDPKEGSSIVSKSGDNAAFQFTIPRNLPLGSYIAEIEILPNGQPGSDQVISSKIVVPNSPTNSLVINSEIGRLSPRVSAVFPLVVYPVDGKYSFTVVGSDFSPTGSDNHLIISQRNKDGSYRSTPEIQVCWDAKEQCLKSKGDIAIGEVLQGNRQLRFSNIPVNKSVVHGELGVQVRVGNETSDPPSPIILSRVEESVPHWWALGLALFVAALVITLNLRPIRRNLNLHTLFGSTLGSLLIDPETNTYSLSRLQFLLWTSVAVISYAFLLFSRVLAQDKLDFLDIPAGLPGIVLISSATSVFGTGISSLKGSKGSAQLQPQCSDFYSAGGYIVPERLQFFVWTIIGVLAYLYLVFFQGSGEIQELPTIPQGFLQLSGVSSFAYLGGKLARDPGPVITSMDKVEYKNGKLFLVINGSNLSKSATFEIEKNTDPLLQIPKDIASVDVQLVGGTGGGTGTGNGSNMGHVLKLAIPYPSGNAWPERPGQPYKLKIFNPDLQFAEWQFDFAHV